MEKWFKKLSPAMQTLVVVIALIILFFIAREIKYRWNKPRVDSSNIPVVGISGNQVIQWDPDPLAQEVATNLEGVNLKTYPDTAQKILDLQTDDQLKLLYNHYNEKYAQDYQTITKLFDNEWSDWEGKYAKVVARFKSLNLN